MKEKLVIGTRASKLALWQANFVAKQLQQAYPKVEVELRHIMTAGDKILDVPLAKIGGKGLFTQELEQAMLEGSIDLAVHSLKDMPAFLPDGLCLAAVLKRENPSDALISPRYHTLEQLPFGAKVGTSSLRRKAQLLHCRQDLVLCDLRGNVDTRLKKVHAGEYDAIVLAAAGLIRLGWEEHITQELSLTQFLPAAGQGVLAIEACNKNYAVLEMLRSLHDDITHQVVTAERAFLQTIEGSCQVPVGVHGWLEREQLCLSAVILATNGQRAVRQRIAGSGTEAKALGQKLGISMLDNGGRDILKSNPTL